MTTMVAVSGISAWVLLIGAAVGGLAFGMWLNARFMGRRRK